MSNTEYSAQSAQFEEEFKEKYSEQLARLLNDERQIKFFCELIDGQLWSKPDERLAAMNYLIRLCEDNSLDVAKAWIYYYLSWHYSENAQCDKAIEVLLLAREIFTFNDKTLGILYAESGLVFMYCDKGLFEKAIYLGVSAISKAEDYGDKDVLLRIMLNTTIANIFLGDYESAMFIMETVRKKFDKSEIRGNGELIYCKCLLEIKLNMGLQGESETLEILNRLEEIMLKSEQEYFLSELLKLKALYYAKTGDYSYADSLYHSADWFATEKGYDILICENLLYWSTLKFEMYEYDRGLAMLSRVKEIADRRGYLRLKRAYNYVLYEYYKNLGEYDAALEHLEAFSAVEGMLPDVNDIIKDSISIDGEERPEEIRNLLDDKNDILLSIGQKIASTFEPLNIVNDVYKELRKLVQMDFFGIVIYDEKKDEINAAVLEDDTVFEIEPINMSFRETFFGACLKNKKVIVTNDILSDYSKYVSRIDLTGRGVVNPISLVFLPLIMNGETLGAMTVQSLRPGAYTPEDISLLKIIANYMTVSIRNSLKYSQIKHESIYDGLTGFYLRNKAYEMAADLISSIGEEHSAVCVAIVDIDDFKRINDTHGHICGDRLLIQFSDLLRENTNRRCMVGRYGGDEFLLIVSDLSKEEHQIQLDKLRTIVEKTVFVPDNGVKEKITVSIGSCYCTDSAVPVEDVVAVADRALYQVKEGEKNSILVEEI